MTQRETSSPFGRQLRRWRAGRGMSQLELATQAGTTSRHVSFLETGRSRPGRELVLRLAATLDLALADRNELLVAAGLAAEFPRRALDDEAMSPITSVIDRVLESHEPYPAWVYARGLRLVRCNRAAEALLPGLCDLAPDAIVDMWFRPGPFRELVENWDDVVWAGIDSLRREARRSPDPDILGLLERAEGLVRELKRPRDAVHPDFPVASPRFRIGDRTVATVATVLRFDTAVEVTASELRVELMFPADEPSAAFFREIAAGA